jgi:hypothetical protein
MRHVTTTNTIHIGVEHINHRCEDMYASSDMTRYPFGAVCGRGKATAGQWESGILSGKPLIQLVFATVPFSSVRLSSSSSRSDKNEHRPMDS